ncbi:phenylacetic acid degradation bifunctional protein PaaZ [Roseomonas haemaphysalidis]|uniref:Phenylacetic acid degradation bifunctional protein PaaZ n=1 Tax=Roseomonas haemaphysalidis TaxID=2768162 RepID=A0ABS3KP63_9PROT|nr:phenylacetic acid degradation bifunctional protein PaaZ [Roseomonas haemaphysalidis]MBO1079230.1 phenylacetic acid degradation bifunctional protein PaaZ [Roseomonas haemaphysalidis]
MALTLQSFAEGHWVPAGADAVDIPSAVDGRVVATASSTGLDFAAMARFARMVGGPALRAMTFHQRAELLKRLAVHLTERKEALYELSFDTGATRRDSWIDIDGGIGTLFAYASRGRKELPSERFILDGAFEPLSRQGSFVGAHILSPLHGVAVHVNAFNFPCWGLLEKLAPALLAGMPVISKPATSTAYVAHAMVAMIVESGILPPGALQFVAGSTGDLLDHLTGQDVVSFTGSAATSGKLRDHPAVSRNAVRFIAERDSLNAAILGSDAAPESPEFDLFVKEVAREMTAKAGQKCTAIRRVIVPRAQVQAVRDALAARLARQRIGNPRDEAVTMGPLSSQGQRRDVRAQVAELARDAEIVFGDPARVEVSGANAERGAFLSPLLLHCADPIRAERVHHVEAFGPVATLLPYDDLDQAVMLAQRGEGSLVASAFSYDPAVTEQLVMGLAPFHGRLYLLDRDSAKEGTGHGSPLPALVHGGPGRAGGGEEMGGMRGVHHYLQRTALQGSPAKLSALTRQWGAGAPTRTDGPHPFRRSFDELAIGDTVETPSRVITLGDIEHFAHFTGDTFYAHMDEEAAKANPFFPGRVAHGYLILSFAAGLFVDPAPGPLLANYGLERLRFLKPVSPGDSIRVRLTVKAKRLGRLPEYGEVRWDAEVFNQHDETVAQYDVLTMSARAP